MLIIECKNGRGYHDGAWGLVFNKKDAHRYKSLAEANEDLVYLNTRSSHRDLFFLRRE